MQNGFLGFHALGKGGREYLEAASAPEPDRLLQTQLQLWGCIRYWALYMMFAGDIEEVCVIVKQNPLFFSIIRNK